jgi:uncharacterized protein (DUF2236 family)
VTEPGVPGPVVPAPDVDRRSLGRPDVYRPQPGRLLPERPGPGSLTWRCASDARGLLLAPATLILQVAHPVVGAGVVDHSTFRSEPWRRLAHTVSSVNRLVFGPASTAAAESQRLRRMHARIRGVDGTGRPYRALEPEAYAWVHLTLVHFFVEVQRILGRPLTPPERAQLYREWRQVGHLLGIRERDLPPDWNAFRRYFDHMVEQTLCDNQAVRDVLAAIARPKVPLAWLPAAAWDPVAGHAGSILQLFTVGTLPAVLRARIGLPWTSRDAARLERNAARLRTLLWLVAPPLLAPPQAWPYLIRARLGGFA